MEQKEGQKIPTVNAAATDPAAVPGLVEPPATAAGPDRGPAPDGAQDALLEAEEDAAEEAAEDEETAADGTADDDAEVAAEAAEEETGAEAGEENQAEAGEGDDTGTPSFEAADRRASVRADSSGVRLTLDDTEAEFTWSEIGAVEYGTARFGRRLTVTVHTRTRRQYPAEVDASGKARVKEWTGELESVLDRYFEE